MKEITLDIIKKLPKVDLHRHLDGSIRISTLLELAKEQGVILPTGDDKQALSDLILKDKNCTSLVNFLEAFHYTLRVLQKSNAITRVFYEMCEDAVNDGLKYLEIRFSPILHTEDGLSLSEVMEAVCKGLAIAELKLQIKARIIVCGLRHLSPQITKDLAEIAWRYKHQGVAAFDLAGPENGFSSVNHKEAFEIIRNKGINCTLHSGEDSNFSSVQDSIHHCGAHRIGHGLAIIQSPELLEYMVNKRIPIECCLTSNHQIKGIKEIKDHPIRKYFDAGAVVVICCDNCTMSNVTTSQEYKLAIDTFQFSVEEVCRLIDYSFASTFLEAPMKQILRRESLIECIKIFSENNYPLDSLISNKDYYLEFTGLNIQDIIENLDDKNRIFKTYKNLPSNNVTLEIIKNLPKSDLHLTFDGSVSIEQMWKEIQLQLAIDKNYFKDIGLEMIQECQDSSEFQKLIQNHSTNNINLPKLIMNQLLQTREQLERGFDDIMNEAIKDSVLYIELTFRPTSHCKLNLTPKEALEIILNCRDKWNAKKDLNINIILNSSTDLDDPIETFKLAKMALNYKSRGVVAFGIFGSEPIGIHSMVHYKKIFALLKENNFNLVQIAGTQDIETIFSTIHDAGASRLSGAFQVHKLPRVLSYLSNYQIPIEISQTDKLKISTKDLTFTTPIRHLIDSNVPVIICSFKSSLYPLSRSEMLFEIAKNAQLNIYQVLRLLKNSFSNSFTCASQRFNASLLFNQKAKHYFQNNLNLNFESLLLSGK